MKEIKKETMKKTVIAFGGFYESKHSAIIENQTEYWFECKDDHNIDYIEYFDWKSIYQSYMVNYVNEFKSYILNEYKINIKFVDLKLDSPKYYNYSTDQIDCTVKDSEINLLNNTLLKDLKFLDYLKQATKSYDGYISFNSYDDALNNKKDCLSLYTLSYLAKKFNETLYELDFDVVLTVKGKKRQDRIQKEINDKIEFESKQYSLQI